MKTNFDSVKVITVFKFSALVEVHEDFFVYKSGIYKHAVRDRVKRSLPDQYNFHSVKIIG